MVGRNDFSPLVEEDVGDRLPRSVIKNLLDRRADSVRVAPVEPFATPRPAPVHVA